MRASSSSSHNNLDKNNSKTRLSITSHSDILSEYFNRLLYLLILPLCWANHKAFRSSKRLPLKGKIIEHRGVQLCNSACKLVKDLLLPVLQITEVIVECSIVISISTIVRMGTDRPAMVWSSWWFSRTVAVFMMLTIRRGLITSFITCLLCRPCHPLLALPLWRRRTCCRGWAVVFWWISF